MSEIPYTDMFSPGDHLILNLLCGDAFRGDYISGGPHRIDLINVRERDNPNKLGGLFSFYKQEIDTINRTKVAEKPPQSKIKDKNEIKICEEEYYRYKTMAREYVYIEKADKQYYDVVNKLKDAETIGVVALGMEPTRDTSIKLLVIATWKEVFLFDLIDHKDGFFYPELKEIFESGNVCKVVHRGSPMIEVLFRKYKIFVRNTFDTHVVDLVIQKTRTGECPSDGREVSECLDVYFNLSTSLIHDHEENSQKKWVDRPLTYDEKLYASQLSTYLVLLKGKMRSLLLAETGKAINKVHDYYYDLSGYDFCVHCQKRKIPKKLKKLIPSLEKLSLNDSYTDENAT